VGNDLDFSGILKGGGVRSVRKTNLEQDNLDILTYYAKILVSYLFSNKKKIFVTFEGCQNK